MKFLAFFLLLSMFVGCSPYHSELDSLGANSSFNDVSIPDDFDETEEEVSGGIEEEVAVITPAPVQVNLKNTFEISSQVFQLARGPALRWDGCEKTKESQGGYNSDSQCGRAYFHPSFADNLNEAFYICISDAAKVAGYPEPARVFIRHIGSYNDRTARNSSRISNHAYARALDIVNFNLYDHQGVRYKVSTYLKDYNGSQADFYDEFRDCWRESLPSSCSPGKTEYKGSVGHQASKLGGNSLHNDHLHLSFPECAG